MGRHESSGNTKRGLSISGPVISIVLLLVIAVGLGVWWLHLRSATDPIDAAPVDAYAVVVTSPACGGDTASSTVVTLSGVAPTVRAALPGCGFRVNSRIAVQYLQGHPDQMRISGTTTGGDTSSLTRWLLIAILAAGVIAVGATILLLVDRRRSRHAGSARRITVTELSANAGRAPSHLNAADGSEPGVAGLASSAGDSSDPTDRFAAAADAPALMHPADPEADLFSHQGPTARP